MKNTLHSIALSYFKEVIFKISLKKFFIMLLCLVIGQALYMTLPGLIGFLTDKVLVQELLSPFYLSLFPLTWTFSIIFSWIGRFYTSILTQEARKESKEIIFRHLIHLPNRFFVNRDAGELENLMQEISFSTRYILNENIPFFLRSFITIGVATVIIFQSSLFISLLFLFWSSLYIPTSYFFAKNSVKNVSDSIVNASAVSASTVEVIQNHELVPAFGTESYEIKRFNNVLQKERDSFNKAQKRIDFSELILRIIQVLLPFSVVLFLIFSENHSKKNPGFLATLFTMTLIFTSQFGDFGKGILSFFEMRERMKTALHRLACDTTLQNKKENPVINKLENWNIILENVSFKYNLSHSGIRNINLKIRQNEKIGLVGFSGAGKTTLLKLLRGLLKPEKGNIFLSEYSLDSIDPKYLTNGISEVSQSIPLFNRSIRENVAYGCNVSDDVIWDVLERAQIADHIRRLPQGLDTVQGVRGQKFSGGERARIAIARAFIRDAKIIILDEAMAAIDSESELLIQKGLEELSRGRTVIAVAHRLSTLKDVDRIIVMDQGQIIAEGTHQELLITCPLYQRLWKVQVAL
ncbi:Lipid A export ATP-binding/permease protein MsbA [Candidatus Rubidus massiliensis]|mgnify:CR=1 FL=1|nr:MAG: hypothetical protein BGO10_11010 [Chlamydia sp. 32-24]CDZ81659.1 Lipid A export ATP-binding/permease protein MsbA [Candidatus Rubidus massiliensis]